jgi:hypothetical protein
MKGKSRREDMRFILFVAIFLLTVPPLAWGLPPSEQETIGVVRNFGGIATVTRGEQVFQAAAGTKLLAGDTLSTGPDGTLGVILRDNSALSLGPGSRLVVLRFLFSPADKELGLLARFSKGTMAYISGLIGKLAPESVRFETPVASIGIRGTYFAVKVEEPAS